MAFPFYAYNIAYLAAGHKGKLMFNAYIGQVAFEMRAVKHKGRLMFNAYAVMGVYACCHRQLNNGGMTVLIWTPDHGQRAAGVPGGSIRKGKLSPSEVRKDFAICSGLLQSEESSGQQDSFLLLTGKGE